MTMLISILYGVHGDNVRNYIDAKTDRHGNSTVTIGQPAVTCALGWQTVHDYLYHLRVSTHPYGQVGFLHTLK